MKTFLKWILIMIFTGLSFTGLKAQVNIDINIGVPGVRYYYIQDIEGYYDSETSMYIILSGGNWVRVKTLPPIYRDFDIHRSHVIVIRDYHGMRPYRYYNIHRTSFPKGVYRSREESYWSPAPHRPSGGNSVRPAKRPSGNNFVRPSNNKPPVLNQGGKGRSSSNGTSRGGKGGGNGNSNGKGKRTR